MNWDFSHKSRVFEHLPKIVSSYFKSSQTLLQATGIWDQQRHAWFVGSHYSWLYYAILCYTAICLPHQFLCLNMVVSIQIVHWSRLKEQACASNGQVSARACFRKVDTNDCIFS